MNDTPPDIEDRIARMMAERTPADRLRMASSMFDSAKTLMRAGLLREDASLTEPQIRARIFLRFYGESFSAPEIDRIIHHIPGMQR